MKVKVRCSYELEIELPDTDEWTEDGNRLIFFHIEENNCPGTGPTGGELYRMLDEAEETGNCCFCGRNGENVVLEINGVPVERDSNGERI